MNKLDEMAIYFSENLSQLNISHIFLSGYVAILFGRNRTSEDIDVVCENISYKKFEDLWHNLSGEFECIITSDVKDAYEGYLMDKIAVRFAYKGEIIPNIELKFQHTGMDRKALENSITVLLNEKRLPISPLEQQIAFKLFMGSEKDIEDARFLFKLFEKNLNTGKLLEYLDALEISIEDAKYYLGWSK